MRLSTRLPCAWQPVTDVLDYSGLRRLFELPQTVEQQFALEDANGAVQDSLRDLADSRLRMALHALDHKIDLVVGMVGYGDEPPEHDVHLSLHGMDLTSSDWLEQGTAVACHLVLDGGYQVPEHGDDITLAPRWRTSTRGGLASCLRWHTRRPRSRVSGRLARFPVGAYRTLISCTACLR